MVKMVNIMYILPQVKKKFITVTEYTNSTQNQLYLKQFENVTWKDTFYGISKRNTIANNIWDNICKTFFQIAISE